MQMPQWARTAAGFTMQCAAWSRHRRPDQPACPLSHAPYDRHQPVPRTLSSIVRASKPSSPRRTRLAREESMMPRTLFRWWSRSIPISSDHLSLSLCAVTGAPSARHRRYDRVREVRAGNHFRRSSAARATRVPILRLTHCILRPAYARLHAGSTCVSVLLATTCVRVQ
jgi:hypothetical protein